MIMRKEYMTPRGQELKAPALTITVPEAAKSLGIGRNQAYEAAHRGEIPVIRIGRRLVVPLAALEHLLQGKLGSSGETRK